MVAPHGEARGEEEETVGCFRAGGEEKPPQRRGLFLCRVV